MKSDGPPGHYRWSAGRVVPGKYELCISQFWYLELIEAVLAGRTDVRVVLGEPADVNVRVVDADSGTDAVVTYVTWHGAWPDDMSGGGGVSSETRDASTGAFRFRVPAGKVSIGVFDDSYMGDDQVFRVQPGRNEITLRVARACGVVISFRDGGTSVSFPGDAFGIEATRLDGRGEGFFCGGNDADVRVRVPSPGRYRVTVPKAKGFEPITPFEVEVMKGEFVRREVTLRRR